MAYTHGVQTSEVATSILPPVEVSAGIPFIVGTAPATVEGNTATVTGKPVLCYTYDEAVKAFGYADPVADGDTGLKKYQYSIHEFIYSHFTLFGASPAIIVNVGATAEADDVAEAFNLVEECFPRFRIVPTILLAPRYSETPAVAAVMATKCAGINGVFTAGVALVDVPTETVKEYSAVAAWKTENNITDARQVVCFPKVALDGVVFSMSTQLAGLLCKVDGQNGDVPYVSPSNKNFQMTAAVLADGTEVLLGKDTAESLNGQGVVTALNFFGGWKCWGNRTACYPDVTDVKDSFIPLRRMFSWVGNTLVQTFWQKLDNPLNRRLIDTIVDSANMWLDGLTAKGYILGGRVEFLDTENTTFDLMDGKVKFHVYITPPSPARQIDFVLEYDTSYVQSLFA